jgi:hypothetical protein
VADLSPEERAAYERETRYVERPVKTVVRPHFVRVPERDYDAEGLRQALSAEVKSNDHYRALAERVLSQGRHIADSLRTSDRMSGEGRRPNDIVVQ